MLSRGDASMATIASGPAVGRPGRGVHAGRRRAPLAPRRSRPGLEQAVRLVVDDPPPSGLQDGSGRSIDGDHNGTPGGDTLAVLSRGGATVQVIASGCTSGQNAGI